MDSNKDVCSKGEMSLNSRSKKRWCTISKNIGKIFEQNWKNSIPDHIFYYRPPDAAQSFGNTQGLRFSAKSPCDCFMFDGEILYVLELKSVGTKSISFEREKSDKGVIHKHQIVTLDEFSKYQNIVSGFILDFRLSDKTYFCSIENFLNLINTINKKSFNEDDMIKYGNSIEIPKRKLKVNYRYDINNFIKLSKEVWYYLFKRNIKYYEST